LTPLSVVAGRTVADLNNLDYIKNLIIFSFSLQFAEEGEYETININESIGLSILRNLCIQPNLTMVQN